MQTIIDDFFLSLVMLISYYGWFIVFFAGMWYFLRPYYREFEQKRSLFEANDPKRKSILDIERKRVRVKQALDHAKRTIKRYEI
jgi:hypothetical protein